MWILNIWLYLAFLAGKQTGDYSLYQSMRSAGATCHVAAPWQDAPVDAPPVCFYDPGAQ